MRRSSFQVQCRNTSKVKCSSKDGSARWGALTELLLESLCHAVLLHVIEFLMVCSLSMAGLISALVAVPDLDIAMVGGLSLLRVFKREGLPIDAVLQDGFSILVRAGPDDQRPDGCLFHTFRAVIPDQTHDVHSGSGPLLGVRPAFQDSAHQFFNVGSLFCCPFDVP